MALNRNGGLVLTAAAAGAATVAAVLAGPAVQAAGPADTAAPPRPALSAELMPVCGPGAMVNIVQAALGQPRPSGPGTPEAALTEFAAVVGLALPTGALERTVPLSDNEAVVRSLTATGHVVRHGNHWQADYLAVCVPVALPNNPDLPAADVPGVPAAPEVPAVPTGPLPVPDLPGQPAASAPDAASAPTSATRPGSR